MKNSSQILRKLGAYGFDHIELVIIASLISEDPLLLIGKAGTGKTFLLNSISEALNLEHRHYNASFLSFDDLVGFPYPDSAGKAVSFLKTPATIWDAESVLIDELSRCKPETQNKFFSIIHEKKIQGMPLEKLRYPWAAMNPLMNESQGAEEFYEGSMALDQALADRFAFIIDVPDWNELTTEEQELVIYPAGEGAITETSQELFALIEELKPEFQTRIKNPEMEIIFYCRIISTLLGDAGYRISPRRARLLARNFTALFLAAEELGYKKDDRPKLFKLALKWSLPHRAWKASIPDHVIDSAHAECMRLMSAGNLHERWVSEFLLTHSLSAKIDMLFNSKINMEFKSLAVIQFLKQDSRTRAGIFAFAAQPLLQINNVIDEEAMSELTKVALKIMNVEGKMEWREGINQSGSKHPVWSSCVHYLNTLQHDVVRKKRAEQFFLYLICNNIPASEPEFIEKELNSCFESMQSFIHKSKRITSN